ncbi:MAG: hypothetical protein QOG43_2053 [Actinomycetota bacterium]|nr:hypothetical protein [Actinomycetota bacterium]
MWGENRLVVDPELEREEAPQLAMQLHSEVHAESSDHSIVVNMNECRPKTEQRNDIQDGRRLIR